MHQPQLLLLQAGDTFTPLLALELERAGYSVTSAPDAGEALTLSSRIPFDLVLISAAAPETVVLALLRQFRQAGGAAIILASRQTAGGEDGPPLRECIDAACGHRDASPPGPRLVVGDLTLSAAGRLATIAGRPVRLAPREFSLLHALASRAGQVVPADELLSRVWGGEFAGEPQVLYVHVRWLRQKLEEDPAHPQRIITRRGAGYLLEPHAPEEAGAGETASGAGMPHASRRSEEGTDAARVLG